MATPNFIYHTFKTSLQAAERCHSIFRGWIKSRQWAQLLNHPLGDETPLTGLPESQGKAFYLERNRALPSPGIPSQQSVYALPCF